MQLEDVRRDYLKGGLHRRHLHDSPLLQFERWMQQAIESGLKDPTAMTLATVDENGAPDQRIVLLKHVDVAGFVFFTNYSSQKALNIANNCQVSLHFPWHNLERQVSVQGKAVRLDREHSAAYFAARPRESQLAALASRQSTVLASRQALLSRFEQLQEQYEGKDIPAPEFWGGYRVVPESIEFWQGGAHRLHDRFQYVREGSVEGGSQWSIQRLAP